MISKSSQNPVARKETKTAPNTTTSPSHLSNVSVSVLKTPSGKASEMVSSVKSVFSSETNTTNTSRTSISRGSGIFFTIGSFVLFYVRCYFVKQNIFR